MILTPAQMKSIADKGRSLPDEILAPLVLSAVLGAIPTSAPAAPSETRPKIAAEPVSPVRAKRRKANQKTRQRIRMVSDFVSRNPGIQIGQIAAGLGLTVPQVRYVLRSNTREVEVRDARTGAKYYPRGYVNGAVAPQVAA